MLHNIIILFQNYDSTIPFADFTNSFFSISPKKLHFYNIILLITENNTDQEN